MHEQNGLALELIILKNGCLFSFLFTKVKTFSYKTSFELWQFCMKRVKFAKCVCFELESMHIEIVIENVSNYV